MKNRRRALVTVAIGPHSELAAASALTRRVFCQANQFDDFIVTQPHQVDRPAAWQKIPVIQELLKDYDEVFALDADAVVVKPETMVDGLVSRRRQFACVSHTYQNQSVPNLGVFMVMRGPFVKQLLEEIWCQTDLINHKWWENAAYLRLAGYDISDEPIKKLGRSFEDRKVTFLSVAWNSIPICQHPEPIIKHYPGTPNDVRLREIENDVRHWWNLSN